MDRRIPLIVAVLLLLSTGAVALPSQATTSTSLPCSTNGNVRARVTFSNVVNTGLGNAQRGVILGDGTLVAEGQWFHLTVNGQTIVDPTLRLQSPYLSIRRFNGYLELLEYGQSSQGGDNYKESVYGTIEIDSGSFTGSMNDTGSFPGHPLEHMGNGTYGTQIPGGNMDDEIFVVPYNGTNLSHVDFFIHENTSSDGFRALYQTPSNCPSSSSASSVASSLVSSSLPSSSAPSSAPSSSSVPSSSLALSSSSSSTLPTSNVSVTKAGPTSVIRGDTFTYTLTVTNSGPNIATNVILIDFPTEGFVFAPQQSDSHCALLGDGSVQCSFATIGVGTTTVPVAFKTIEWQVCSLWTVINRARVTATNDPTPSGNSNAITTIVNCPGASSSSAPRSSSVPGSSSASSTSSSTSSSFSSASSAISSTSSSSSLSSTSSASSVSSTADLSMSKSGPSVVVRGNTATYFIMVSNAGPAAALNVTVTDPIPSGFTFLTYTSNANCSVQGNNIVCTQGTIPSSQSMTISLVFTVPLIGNCTTMTVQNAASVTNSVSDPQMSNNISQTVYTAVHCGGTTIVFQCSDGRDNDGDGYVDFPADLGCISRTDESEYDLIALTYQCSDGRDNDGDGYVDYPADTGCESTIDDSENSGGGTTMSLLKTVDRPEAVPGDLLLYTLTLRNESNQSAWNVTVEDSMDAAAGSTVVDPGGAQVNGNVLRWNVGTIEAHAIRTITYRLRLGYGAQGYVTNRVVARGSFGDITNSATVHILEQLPQTGFFTDLLTPPSVHLKKIRKNNMEESSGFAAMTLWLSLLGIGSGGAGLVVRRKFF